MGALGLINMGDSRMCRCGHWAWEHYRRQWPWGPCKKVDCPCKKFVPENGKNGGPGRLESPESIILYFILLLVQTGAVEVHHGGCPAASKQ